MDIHNIDTVSFDREANALVIIDQTLLPGEVRLLPLTDRDSIFEAIRSLRPSGSLCSPRGELPPRLKRLKKTSKRTAPFSPPRDRRLSTFSGR